jgi:hypothetical protein
MKNISPLQIYPLYPLPSWWEAGKTESLMGASSVISVTSRVFSLLELKIKEHFL